MEDIISVLVVIETVALKLALLILLLIGLWKIICRELQRDK